MAAWPARCWTTPGTAWQPAPAHRFKRHTTTGVLAMTAEGLVAITDTATDDDTLIAPCSAFPEPCDQLRVSGADSQRIYLTGFAAGIYAVESGR